MLIAWNVNVLLNSEEFNFNIVLYKYEIDSKATLLDLAKDLNVYDNFTVEFWINNKLLYPDDNLKLIDLGFNPQTDIIEVNKHRYTEYDSPETVCSIRDKEQIGIEKIEIMIFRYRKIIYVWEKILENLEKIREDLLISLKFRKSLGDNKFEKRIIEHISDEIMGLIRNFFEEIKKKIREIE